TRCGGGQSPRAMPALRFSAIEPVMTVVRRMVLWLLAVTAATTVFVAGDRPAAAAEISLAPGVSRGIDRYVERRYRFSFWYPRGTTIKALPSNDDKSFPGGVLVETLQVGAAGAVSVHVVSSPGSTITDEPDGHASPIAQSRYFYDLSSQR